MCPFHISKPRGKKEKFNCADDQEETNNRYIPHLCKRQFLLSPTSWRMIQELKKMQTGAMTP